MKLSVVMPVFNEEETVLSVINAVKSVDVGMDKEIILVDDGSSDGTRKILNGVNDAEVKIFFHDKNKGKGAALRTGFAHASGDVVLVQDADLEYPPSNFSVLLGPILNGADVVYGSRFVGKSFKDHGSFLLSHYVGNKFLTLATNFIYNIEITDMETCYKVMKKNVLDKVLPLLKEDRFGFEPEITARIARAGFKIIEVPVVFKPRDFSAGKKITWRDGIKALWYLVKYRFF